MGRITHAASHLPVEMVKARMVAAPNQTQRHRWAIVYNALVEPLSWLLVLSAADSLRYHSNNVGYCHYLIDISMVVGGGLQLDGASSHDRSCACATAWSSDHAPPFVMLRC